MTQQTETRGSFGPIKTKPTRFLGEKISHPLTNLTTFARELFSLVVCARLSWPLYQASVYSRCSCCDVTYTQHESEEMADRPGRYSKKHYLRRPRPQLNATRPTSPAPRNGHEVSKTVCYEHPACRRSGNRLFPRKNSTVFRR